MLIRKCLKASNLLRKQTFSYHNLYDTLEVGHGASQEDIKRKYYQLAKKYHPDSQNNTQNAQKFVKINQAYEILGDEKKRKSYDSSFFSSQYTQYNQSNYNYTYESERDRRYREQEEAAYNEPFISLLRKSYFSVFLGLCYAYMAYTIVSFAMDKVTQHEIEEKQKLIDNTPGVIARRKKYYEKIIKEKNIYSLPVDLKYRTLQKESTRSK